MDTSESSPSLEEKMNLAAVCWLSRKYRYSDILKAQVTLARYHGYIAVHPLEAKGLHHIGSSQFVTCKLISCWNKGFAFLLLWLFMGSHI